MNLTSRGNLHLLRVFLSVHFQAIIKQTLLRYQSNTSVLHILSFEAEENSPKHWKLMADCFLSTAVCFLFPASVFSH